MAKPKFRYQMVWLEWSGGCGEDVRKRIYTDKKGKKYVMVDGERVPLRKSVPKIPDVYAIEYADDDGVTSVTFN